MPYWEIGKTLNAEHEYAESIAVLTTFRHKNGFEPPLLSAERGYALGRSGRRRDALAVAQSDMHAGGRSGWAVYRQHDGTNHEIPERHDLCIASGLPSTVDTMGDVSGIADVAFLDGNLSVDGAQDEAATHMP